MNNSNPQKTKKGLREIASAAHVSIATVSRVLNGNSRVDRTIQKTVLDAAANLNVNFSPRNKVKALAFLLSNRAMLHAFHSQILIGAEAYVAAQGWDMVFLSFNYSPTISWKEVHLPTVVQRRDVVRAVMLAGTNSTNLIEKLAHEGIPYVLLGNNILDEIRDFMNNDIVLSDDIGGAQDMTRYLIGMGHRHIWFVGNTRLPWFARCFDGYSRAMKAAELAPRQSSIDSEDDTEVGYLGTKSLLARREAVTAIFSGNDPTAHGVYKALLDSGLRIPEDISVTGCDDTVGALLYPQLTTIRKFPIQLGKQMARVALDRIANPSLEVQCAIIPTELVKRDSCRRINSFNDLPGKF
jgi:DNA-binding LacI/PurR family transcriptional regulator